MKKMPLRKMTQEEVEQAVKSYNEGMSLGALAIVYKVTRQSMWELLRRRTKLRSGLRFGHENHFYRGGSRADKRAHDLTEKAIGRGEIVNPGKCSLCGFIGRFGDGRNSIQAHHDDYNYPLKVRWLCQPCHHSWHAHNQPIAKISDSAT